MLSSLAISSSSLVNKGRHGQLAALNGCGTCRRPAGGSCLSNFNSAPFILHAVEWRPCSTAKPLSDATNPQYASAKECRQVLGLIKSLNCYLKILWQFSGMAECTLTSTHSFLWVSVMWLLLYDAAMIVSQPQAGRSVSPRTLNLAAGFGRGEKMLDLR